MTNQELRENLRDDLVGAFLVQLLEANGPFMNAITHSTMAALNDDFETFDDQRRTDKGVERSCRSLARDVFRYSAGSIANAIADHYEYVVETFAEIIEFHGAFDPDMRD